MGWTKRICVRPAPRYFEEWAGLLIEVIPSRKGASRKPEDPDPNKERRHLVYVYGRARRRGGGREEQKHAQERGESTPTWDFLPRRCRSFSRFSDSGSTSNSVLLNGSGLAAKMDCNCLRSDDIPLLREVEATGWPERSVLSSLFAEN
jgi:hypothetical protein